MFLLSDLFSNFSKLQSKSLKLAQKVAPKFILISSISQFVFSFSFSLFIFSLTFLSIFANSFQVFAAIGNVGGNASNNFSQNSISNSGSYIINGNNSSQNSSQNNNFSNSNEQNSEQSSKSKEVIDQLIIKDEELYKIPSKFSSSDLIQKYLEKNNSLLAKYEVEINLENDDPVVNSKKNLPENLNSKKILAKKTKMLASQLIWELSTTNLANGCSISNSKVCLENDKKPINPAFLMALIQKESGLIFGKNSKMDPNKDETKFLLDRATGFYCMEVDKKEGGCWDENPDWKYYKGFFRQTYFATRVLNLTAKRCEMGKDFGLKLKGGTFFTDNVVTINNDQIRPKNAITCALFTFTPHISAQKLFRNTFDQISK